MNLTDLRCQVYYWTTIRKNRSKYNLTRGINEDDITRILLHEVVVAKDPQKAEASLLALPGLRRYHENLQTGREKEDFRRHLRRYINIWMPDCPFEVSTTNRYTIVTHEAAVIARHPIKKGDVIRYLCGQLVSMTAEEELDLDLTRRDFSVVMSSRKKTPSFFLGPARFANHDCDANARLVTRGSDSMEVVAARDIDLGEEVTVTYGDNYFGEDNRECLCLTCEKNGRGGWPPVEKSRSTTSTSTPAEVHLEAPGPYGLRSSKRRASHLDSTPDTSEGHSRKRPRAGTQAPSPKENGGRRQNGQSSTLRNLPRRTSILRKALVSSDDVQADSISRRTRSSTAAAESISRKTRSSTAAPESGSRKTRSSTAAAEPSLILPKEEDDLVASVKAAFAKAKSHGKRKRNTTDLSDKLEPPRKTRTSPSLSLVQLCSKNSRPIISVSDTPSTPSNPRLVAPNTVVNGQRTSSSTSRTSSMRDDSIPPSSTPATSLDPNDLSNELPTKPIKSEHPESQLSELPSCTAVDDDTPTVVTKKGKFGKPHIPASAVLPTVEPPSLTIPDTSDTKAKLKARSPGDYIRTPLLLGEKYSRWVDCHTCPGTWVQANSYLTKKECPRCERHSKLYGYRWPKTEKQHSGDAERVMDHRTVHRFIRPEEERKMKKRGKGLTAEEREELEEEDEEEEEEIEEVVEKPVEKKKKKKPKTRPGWKGWVEIPIKRGRGRPRKKKY